MIISNEILKSYLCCAYKAFLINNCVQGNNTYFSDFLRQRENEFRVKANNKLINNFDLEGVIPKAHSNNYDLKRGKNLLLGVEIKYEDIQAQVDALEKVKINSALGSYSYRPYVFIPKNRICKKEKIFLAYIGYTLGLIQEKKIDHGFLLYGEALKKSKVNLTKYQHIVAALVEELRTLYSDNKQPKLLLNRHCPKCAFELDCYKEARSTDDLSLLRGMKEKKIKALNSKGIFTVTQYSFTFRHKKRRKRETNLIKRRYHSLQALAIREQNLIVYGKPCIQKSPVCMYMDIETDPYRDFVYLIGLIISGNDGIKKYSFWADSINEESKIVKEFLKVVRKFDKFILIHYGNIETKYIKSLLRADKGRNEDVLEKIIKNSINLLSVIYKHFLFINYYNMLNTPRAAPRIPRVTDNKPISAVVRII
jgi:predicted RecB family nuclease